MPRSVKFTASLLAILITLSACGSSDSDPTSASAGLAQSTSATTSHGGDAGHGEEASPSRATGELQVALVASELVVGPNRFAVGLFGPDGANIDDGTVQFRYFDLTNPQTPVPESMATAERLQSPDGLTTIYAHERAFERAGSWGVEVAVELPDGTYHRKGVRFEVVADSAAILPGEQAPPSESLTNADVDGDLTRLTSASDPNPAFYEQSIADAVTSGIPTLILFATPSFCETRFCGPGYEIVSTIQQRYGAAINVVHVEVYQGLPDPAASNWALAEAMVDFGLTTEPWLYLVDQTGTVVYRVEALFTAEEIERQLELLGVAAPQS